MTITHRPAVDELAAQELEAMRPRVQRERPPIALPREGSLPILLTAVAAGFLAMAVLVLTLALAPAWSPLPGLATLASAAWLIYAIRRMVPRRAR